MKQYRHVGHSTPGLLKGNRWNVGVAKPIEHTELKSHPGILYVTKFHYRKDFSLWFNMKSYYLYFLQKFRYQFAQYAG